MKKFFLVIFAILLPVLVQAQTDEITAGEGTDLILYANGKLLINNFSKHIDKGEKPSLAGDFNYWNFKDEIGSYDKNSDVFTVNLAEFIVEGANRVGIKTDKGWLQGSTFGKHILIRRTSQQSASGKGDPVIAIYREGARFVPVPKEKNNEIIDRQVD